MKAEQIIDEMQASLTKLRGHFRLTGTAGECTCSPFSDSIDPCCPKHGLPRVTPDLPLHVRVAKALGKKVRYHNGEWQEYYEDINAWLPVLGRDKKVERAMGALEEYQKGFDVWMYRYAKWETQWRVNFGNGLVVIDNNSLPQAICEAIVKHAGGEQCG